MPLFKGVNEAPTGFNEDWPGLTSGDIPGRENILSLYEGAAAGAGLDPSNCLNRSRLDCCAAFWAGNGVDESNKLDRSPFWLCPVKVRSSGLE